MKNKLLWLTLLFLTALMIGASLPPAWMATHDEQRYYQEDSDWRNPKWDLSDPYAIRPMNAYTGWRTDDTQTVESTSLQA